MKKLFLALALAFLVPVPALPNLIGGGVASNPSGSGGFSPISVSPYLWLDPNDSTFSTNTVLGDKSGNGRDFTFRSVAPTYSAGPNGTTVVSNTGGYIETTYNGPSLTNFEIWFVVKRTSEAANAAFARYITFFGKFSIGFHTDPGYGPMQIVMNSGTDYKGAVTLDLTNYYLYRAVYSSGTWTVWQNGVSKAVTSAGDYAPLDGVTSRIGGGEYGSAWIGLSGDLIITPALTAGQVTNMYLYLNTKYGF
jgi:hypothetical protein